MLSGFNSKIKSKKAIKQALVKPISDGKSIVAISGTFDVLHIGHVKTLVEAKKSGDILVVLLNSDVSVNLYKGVGRPVISERYRAQMLAALECVDYVVVFSEVNPKKILDLVRPNTYCVSSEWGLNCVEAETVVRNGGKVLVLKHDPLLESTTDIFRRIQKLESGKVVKAVFLDRDGTINENGKGYISKKEDFVFLPGVISGLKRLKKAGYLLFVVTNQSGVGRGLYTEFDLKKLHSWFMRKCRENGVIIDKIYYCPHAPDDGCGCRKPGYELLLKGATEYNVNLSKSWMVGDSISDIEAGREVNLKTILIGNRQQPKDFNLFGPQYIAKNFKEAIDIVLSLTNHE